jgi:hypothetical protein
MAEITTTQSFSDGDTVTATKLNNIQGNASIQPESITNRTAETSIDQANDLLLIYDASATALKKVSASNLIKAGTASDFPITGNATIGGTLGVTGAITATSTINGTTIPTTKTLVTTVDTQTLTNKTLTSPSISDPTITGQITASTSIINVGSGQIYKDATGKFGVGTASPANTLHVNGAISIQNGPTYATSGAGLELWYNTSLGVAEIISYDRTNNLDKKLDLSGSQVTITSNSAERLRIDSSGNVGIGTTSPPSKLAVIGTSTNAGGISLNASDVHTVITHDGVTNGGKIQVLAGGNSSTIGTTPYRLLLQPEGGNVGIGTTSPNTKLDINASANSGIRVTNGTMSGVFFNNSDTSIAIGTQSNHPVTLYSNDAERVRIDTSGNVGIGATSPTTKLHVSGLNSTARFYTNGDPVGSTLYLQDLGGATGNGGQILFGAHQGVFAGIKAYIDNGTGPAGSLILQTRNVSGNILERMSIDSIGNVNVGNESVDTLRYLDVTNGNTGANAGSIIRLITSNVAGSGLTIVDIVKYKNGQFAINNGETNASAFTSFNVGATERLRIASSGQIGIGGANYGTSGQVLTSAGASTAPSWKTISPAKAWVNFNGAADTINAAYNVSSITDLGTGWYGINFASSFVNTEYTFVGSTMSEAGTVAGPDFRVVQERSTDTRTTGACKIWTKNRSDGASEPVKVFLAFFGD